MKLLSRDAQGKISPGKYSDTTTLQGSNQHQNIHRRSIAVDYCHMHNGRSLGVPMDWKEQQIQIRPLLPGGEYAMEIMSVFQGLTSTAARIPFMQFPAPPRNFRKLAMLTNETSLVLQWDPAEGFVDTYYLLIDAPVQPNESLAPPFTFRHVFQKLKPGQTYQVAITSVRGNFSSVPSVINATTSKWSSERPVITEIESEISLHHKPACSNSA